jgi:hypothetical protein
LFSGLLKCESCGANFVRLDKYTYRCATHTNGGRAACGSDFKLNSAEAERARLLNQAEKTIDLYVAKVARLLPNAVGEYRTKVARLRDGRGTLSDAEYIETRGLVFDLLGGSVPVEPRAGGSAALHLEIDVAPIAKAYGSMTYKLVAGA